MKNATCAFINIFPFSAGASIYIIFAVFAIYHKLETEEREEQQKQKRGVRMASGTEELDAATTYATLENEWAVQRRRKT